MMITSTLPAGLLVGSCVAFCGAYAAEQPPVYRCGQAYQDSPCPGGVAVDVGDPRTESQRADRREAVEREIRLGDRMQRERLAEEQRQRPLGAANLSPRPKPAAKEAHAKASPSKKKAVRTRSKPRKPAAA